VAVDIVRRDIRVGERERQNGCCLPHDDGCGQKAFSRPLSAPQRAASSSQQSARSKQLMCACREA